MVDDAGRSRDQVDVVFPLDAFLDHIHVQHAQKSASEPEPQRLRGLRLILQRSVVELELFQRFAQIIVFGIIDRVQSAIDHRVHAAVSGKRLCRRAKGRGDGIADMHVRDVFDGSGDPAYLAAGQPFLLDFLRGADTDLQHFILPFSGHEADLVPHGHRSLLDAHERDDAAIRIIQRIEDERLQRRVHIS